MMTKKVISLFLLAVFAVSLISAGVIARDRIDKEAHNRQVELSVEYGQILEVAGQGNHSYEEVLDNLQLAGVTGILYKEQTIIDLEQQVWTVSGNQLLAGSDLDDQLKTQVVPEYIYLATRDKNLYTRISKQFAIKVHEPEQIEIPGRLYLVGAKLSTKQLANLGLGFPEEHMKIAESKGFNLQVQIRSWPQPDDEDFSSLFADLGHFANLNLVLFNDKTIPGYPGKYLLLAEEIRKLGVPIGLIEFYNQKGFTQLANALDKKVIRLHSIDPAQMATTSPQTAIERYTLAVTDRNIRNILVRFVLDEESSTKLNDNVIYLTKVKNSIAEQGFALGSPASLEGPTYSGLLLFMVGVGVIVGGILLANVLGLPMPGLILGTLAALGWLALLVTGNALVGRKFLALAATIIFPSLGILLGLKGEGSGLKGSVLILLRTSSISLCGALLMVGLLSDLSFMLKLNEFSGVKLAHVAPLIIIACVIVWLTEKRETVKVIIEFLASNIKVWYALVVGIMTVALLIYILRTGNDAPVVSTLELQFRGWLEKVLKVRPRTKEFLIGHPLLLLTFYLGYRHRFLPILLLGSIGQISLVNTFAHIHTPLLISVVRAFNGLWLGIIIGIVLIMLFRIVLELGRRNYYG
jgi:hypothetical protein